MGTDDDMREVREWLRRTEEKASERHEKLNDKLDRVISENASQHAALKDEIARIDGVAKQNKVKIGMMVSGIAVFFSSIVSYFFKTTV